jgi:methionine-S-sulfoxide reductase
VVRTRVGYTGGTTENPTYRNIGDHTESIQVDYDPTQITYQELLDMFWQSHNPRTQAITCQYKAVVFYHDREQKRLAEASRDRLASEIGDEVMTEILPAGTFTLAEDYHQKYNLKRYGQIYGELAAIYPRTEELIASTAAARINGYLGGYGTRAQLEGELESLGLSTEAGERLQRMVMR